MERDPETGKIVRVVHAGKRANPLNDPLNTDSEDEAGDNEGGKWDDGRFEGFDGVDKVGKGGEIVRMLEEQANRGERKTERKQSEREREWIERLVGRWGEDFARMARDRKLNPMQQTEKDIRRRVEKWRKGNEGEVAAAEGQD